MLNRRLFITILIALSLMIPLISCDKNVIEPGDPDDPIEQPEKAINPSPPDGASNLPAGTDLSWEIDGDSSSYTFDIYFGTISPPPPVSSGVTECSYDPGTLEFETTYYWRVDSVIGKATTQGDEWSFTTGAELVRLTFSDADDSLPCWSPDSKRIVFTSERSGNKDLWIIPATGGKPIQLTTYDGYDYFPDWSSDDSYIAYSSDDTWHNDFNIFKIPVSGGKSIQLTDDAVYWNAAPSWSPDCSRLVFTRYYPGQGGYEYIVVIDADGSNERNLDFTNYASFGGPSWSPVSSLVVYNVGYNGESDLWILNVDEHGYHEQLTDFPGFSGGACWTPDGYRIAFHSNMNGNNDIYTMHTSTGAPFQITTDPMNDSSPSWSPDGNKIAFASDRSGNYDI